MSVDSILEQMVRRREHVTLKANKTKCEVCVSGGITATGRKPIDALQASARANGIMLECRSSREDELQLALEQAANRLKDLAEGLHSRGLRDRLRNIADTGHRLARAALEVGP